MKEIDDYNWDSLYRQVRIWMDRERIPGRVNTGRKSMTNRCPIVDIHIPCKGNKAIIGRIRNYHGM